MINQHLFQTLDETIQELVKQISVVIQQVNAKKGSCSIALAGGNTPKPLYQALSSQRLDWDAVRLTLTDERWLDVSHDDSNENMIRKELMQNQANKCQFIGLKNSAMSPEQGIKDVQASLTQKIGELDIVILGMGEDGHFASIFPAMNNTTELLDFNNHNICDAALPAGKEPRMSLTLAYILKASNIYLFITGEKKKKIIAEILSNQTNNTHEQYPISALLKQTITPVNIYWNP